MDKPKDLYQILGVPRDASPSAIKRAFRRLARRYRPEHSSETAVPGLAELQAAYETLSDEERRRRYDDELGAERPVRPEPLVRHPPASDLRRPFTPVSLAAEVILSAQDAARGTVVALEVPLSATCDVCDGTGGELFDCRRCLGDGKVARRFPVPLHVPAGTRDGTVFHVRTGDPALPALLLTVHLQRSR
ncbi:MAG TPA: DnaJ domain-containing protein [Vicinamibacteria bacterium]|nr:DnaJ domain-containing protein [Vicinamibacteria bacterium]